LKHLVSILSIAILSFFIVIILSCSQKLNKNEQEKLYSKNQQYLFALLENYKAEYSATKSQTLKDSIQNKYLDKIQGFLFDSLGRYIDSIKVTVDTVIQEGWLITTQFHTRDIEFKYGMKYKENMPPNVDSEYHYIRSLKPKSEVELNFVHIGAGELNNPEDTTVRILRIFAFPQKLSARPK
jgi:hypothetical protein